MKKISVVIPVYNNPKELYLTLNALSIQTLASNEFEVLIVDDGSSIHMKSVLREFEGRMNLKYFWQEDKGFCPGTARNLGIRAACGELCVFLDSGVIPVSTCLEEYYNTYRKSEKETVILGYVYGNDIYSDLQEMRDIINSHAPDDAALIMGSKNMLDGRERLYTEFGDELAEWPVPWVVLWSLNFAVSTQFMRDNQIYFDEYFTTWGGEDNEFGIQLLNHGAVYVLCRAAKAIHYPAKIRSYDKLNHDEVFRKNSIQNQKYIVSKYPQDYAVRLWYEKGWVRVNRILIEERSGGLLKS